MVEPLKKVMDMPFDEAVKRVETVVKEEGFSHMLTKNIDDILREKLGVEDYPKYTVILACGPKFAKAALDVSKDVGLLFPCTFSVYEDDGKVWVGHVSLMKIAPAIGLAPADAMQPVIEMTGAAVRAAWERF
jgi:uncharacterized protein (DUF302 family)